MVSLKLLAKISSLIAKLTGLYFPEDRFPDLERSLKDIAHDLDFNDVESLAGWMLSSQIKLHEFDIIIRRLTIGETYFFRDKHIFDSLEYHVLPELIRHKRETQQTIRVWSAGCATGEEAYSIAILLDRLIHDLKNWNLTIIGTDINREAIKKANLGIFRNWSFRAAPPWLEDNYFIKEDSHFKIRPRIKKMVNFSYLNLTDNIYPSSANNTQFMDLIICRNVLMYFTPDHIRQAIVRLYHSNAEGGYLIVSPWEASHLLFQQFTTLNFPGAIIYKKDDVPAMDFPATGLPEKIVPASSLLVKKPDTISYEDACSLYERGHYARALNNLQALTDKDPDDLRLIILLIKIYAGQGRFDEAMHWCKRGIAMNKLNPDIYFLQASVLQEKGQIKEAIKSFNKLLYIDPGFIPAHIALGNLFRSQGRTEISNRHFHNALSVLSGLPDDEQVPGSEGLTAGQLAETVKNIYIAD